MWLIRNWQDIEVIVLTLAEILEVLTNIRPPVNTPVITDAVIDSRQVIPGCLFVALPGEKVDGHEYVLDAFERGASFALIERDVQGDIRVADMRNLILPDEISSLEPPFCLRVENTLEALQKIARYWRQKLNIKVIGITGSVGKSTTKELVADVLAERYKTLKNPGNLNNEIGLPLTILKLGYSHERAVLEMGFYVPGEISFLCEIAKPQIGIVTNIGTVHAERAGSQEKIFAGKTELVKALPPSPDGVAILNFDDHLVRSMGKQTTARVFYYGLDPLADLWADQVESLGLEGIQFRLHFDGDSIHVKIPLIGQHSVHTALRAAAVGLTEGLSWQEIINGLHSGHSQLRLVVVRSSNGALLLDDTYNASPESSLAALNLLADLEGRRLAVLGDMLELGQYEQQGHELVGMRAAQVADHLITLGERSHITAQAARKAGMSAGKINEFEKPGDLISFMQSFLTSKDVVLVKGSRGINMDQIVLALEGFR